MTDAPTPREVVRRAMDKRRSAAHGGRFTEIRSNVDECADGVCACMRTLRRDADAILAALAAAGYAVVPREPTKQAIYAGGDVITRSVQAMAMEEHAPDDVAEAAYRAMLAAAEAPRDGE